MEAERIRRQGRRGRANKESRKWDQKSIPLGNCNRRTHTAALVTLTLAAKVLSAMSAAFCSASVEEAFQISALFLPLSPNPPRFHLRWS